MRQHFGKKQSLTAFALAVMLCCGLLLSNPVQSSGNDSTAVITGFVYDQNDRPLEGARVSLRSDDNPVSIRAVNRNGFFAFLAVLPGEYVVVTQLDGYNTCSAGFTIYPNQTKSVRFRLPPTLRTISHITTGPWGRCHTREPTPLVGF
jgi:hypothetical protein